MAAHLGIVPVTFEVVLRHGDTEVVIGEITQEVAIEFTMPPAPMQPVQRTCGCPPDTEGCQRNPVTGESGHLYGGGKAASDSNGG